MKQAKKLASLLLALVMVFALTATAFADEGETQPDEPAQPTPTTVTISVKADDTHTYSIYQIFTGEISEGILSNVKWGENGTGDKGTDVPTTVLTELKDTNSGTDAQKLAVIKKYVGLDGTAFTTASQGSPATVPVGYYLIQDDGADDMTGDAYSAYIVKVANDVAIEPKKAAPTVDKQVHDEIIDKDSTADDQGWGETADHNIGESFQFRLTAKVPVDPDLDAYKTYKLVFHDTMSDGITFEGIHTVTVNGTSIPATDYACTANPGQEGGSWTLTIENLRALPKSKPLSTIRGAEIIVTYDAHLNGNAVIGNIDDNNNKVKLEYSNNPNSDDLGETTEDVVYVFTYTLENTKVKGDTNPQQPLAGAGFKLQNSDGKWYKLNGKLVSWVDNKDDGTEVTSAADGKFTFSGLDAGTYTLVETTTPAGYNTCADTTVVISATHKEDANGASTEIKVNGSNASGVTIENRAGTQLPSTGGVGTTLFYVIGSVLVLAAVVLLVTKKRMSAQN